MNIDAARLISVGHLKPTSDWVLRGQRHRFHEMIVVYRGKIHLNINGGDLLGCPGDILFYQAGHTHDEQAHPDAQLETCWISFEWNTGPSVPPILVQDRQGRVRQLLQWLREEWISQEAGAAATRIRFFQSILTEWHRLMTHREHLLVEKTRRFVRQHIDRHVSLDELAKHAGLSKYHFARVYRRLAGRTPMSDARAARIEEAQQLVLTTKLPLKEIAPLCGLGDQYRLSRLFRRYLNATPGEIRANIRR